MSRTNFDVIKDMSVEEMAEFLSRIYCYHEDVDGNVIFDKEKVNDIKTLIEEFLKEDILENLKSATNGKNGG